MPQFDITIWGSRGSFPAAGAAMRVYGGNTSCVEVRVADRTLVLDAGTGIEALGRALIQRGAPPIDLFLTHGHYDHVMGLPFFAPLHTPDYPVTLHYAGCDAAKDGAALLDQLIDTPFLPFRASDFRGDLRHERLQAPSIIELGDGCTLSTFSVNHPGGSLAFRLSYAGQSFVYLPDFEHDDGPQDAALISFLQGADLALMDCCYLPQEYPKFKGFGHSHWQRVSELADAADVGKWGAFHHAHTRSDAELDALSQSISEADPRGFVVKEGMTIDLTAPQL